MLKNLSLSLLLVLASNVLIAQNLSLPLVFSDHMVLQRDADIQVWGWADAGSKVTIELNDDSRTTTADFESGRWETFLPSQHAGGPYTLSVSSGEEMIAVDDVYIGDVWLAGGQSNMEWKLSWEVEHWEEEVANSDDYPEIRFFDIPQTTAYEPKTDIPGGEWKIADPKNAGDFSAVAWYFAKLNHAEKGVPVGIVESNWGGTPAESWAPATRLLKVEGYKDAAREVLDPNKDWEAEFANNAANIEQRNSLVASPEVGEEAGVHQTDFDDSSWKTVQIPTEEPLTDVAWLRRNFEVSATDISSARFFTGDVYQVVDVYINGNHIGRKGWQDPSDTLEVDPGVLKSGSNLVALRATSNWNNQIVMSAGEDVAISINKDKINLTGEW